MKKSLIKGLLTFVGMMFFTLISQQVFAQCNPYVTDKSGNDVTTATFCEGELIQFTANSPGFTTNILWEFGESPTQTNSTDQNPSKAYAEAGTYTVTFTGAGGAGNCTKVLNLTIEPSPKINVQIVNSDYQCFEGNNFCFVDSTTAVAGSTIDSTVFIFSDGEKITNAYPNGPFNFCKTVIDPTGGYFDMVIQAEDANGCVARKVLDDYFYVNPKLGIEFDNITPGPNPGCDSTLGRYKNLSTIPLKNVKSFCWYWGDGSSICGDSITNTEWWDGPAGDGVVEHMYNINGTFDGKLVVEADYDCKDSFFWKAAVTNIVLKPVILADKDSSCTSDNPVCFSLQGGPPQGASAWLWNFGDPPSGPANFNDEEWDPCHNYGAGQWMITLRIIAGPCDVTVYDTISKIGPGSTIEVAFDRVAEKEAYQCVITDTVRFPNNSAFYHNDPTQDDEDSIIYYYDYTFGIYRDPSTPFDSLQYSVWEEDRTGNKRQSFKRYAITESIFENGIEVYFDSAKDSLAVVENGDTTYHGKPLYGLNPKKRYVFNFTPANPSGAGAGDQTAVPPVINLRGYDPHVWRVWDFGDRFAPQCTTDSRPWVNKNIGINCNWSIDSNPVHWYTPWDEIYETFNNRRNYIRPYAQTRLHKTTRSCYQVNIYPDSMMVAPKQVVLTIPYDSTYKYTYNPVETSPGVFEDQDTITILANGSYQKSLIPEDTTIIGSDTFIHSEFTLTVRRPPSCFVGTVVWYDALKDSFYAINVGDDTTRHDPYRLGRDNPINGNGTTTWTVVDFDMEFYVPSGVTLEIQKLAAPGGGGAGVGTSRSVTGPKTEIIEADEQFILLSGDSLKTNFYEEVIDADTTYAQPSFYPVDTIIFGTPTTVNLQAVFIDSALHREQYFLDNGQCFQVELWHQDTVHPFMCESTSNKSLALIPPSAKGLEWTGGIPCPLDGDNLTYFLEFDMGETKPGCSQQWFAVNYDSLADPNNFIAFNSGGVLAPPAPGSPIPFVMPYDIVGSYGTTFIKGYTPGEIGNDPALRSPNGSFTIGLIVGNGQPDPNGGPPACLDTFWYNDMFRILYLNADFTIISPNYEPKTICAGGTAYFNIDEPIQDSIKTLRWAWGYQGIGRGVDLAVYIEQFNYYEPYTGPSSTRNDKDIVYNGEDWLYNYVIRQNLSDVTGLEVIDTIVTAIIKDWRIVANTRNADQLVKDAFKSIGLYYNELPEDEIPYYLGDGTFGCIDTTGLSQFFTFGIKPYSQKIDPDVWMTGDKRMRCTSYSPSTIPDTTFAYDGTGARIKSLVDTSKDSIVSIGTRRNFDREDCIDSMEVAHILHFRDSSIQGFDSLEIDTNFDGIKDMVRGVWRYDYMYPEIVSLDPCNPGIKDTIYKPANGPMVPTLYLNNTVGCEKRGAKLLNVGFLNEFWVDNENICNGLVVRLEDSIRYWQYGEQDPPTYPIFPYDFWHDPIRYIGNREVFEADWDESDGLGPIWERSLTLNHIYDEPGEYTVTIVAQDSSTTPCFDTTRLKVYITDVIPNFGISNGFLNCVTYVDFVDSTIVKDPCTAKDTCKNGVSLACDSIIKWEWNFGDNTRKSLLQNPSHDYTKGGWFDVTLKVWTELGCVDSIVQRIYIPGPQPEFEFDLQVWNDQDSAIICIGDSVILKNLSGGDKEDPEWVMDWGDGRISNPGDSGTFFGHTYDSVGTFELYLTQFDKIPGTNQRCSRTFPDTNPDLVNQRKIKVVVLPRAPAEMEISDTIVCPDDLITFTAHVDSLYERFYWVFGDNDTITEFYPDTTTTHSYGQPGVYNVQLIPNYTPLPFTPQCVDTAYGTVTVVDVVAGFTIDSTYRPEFCFTNTSTGAITYEWTFQDDPDGSSTETDPCYNWGDRRGTYEVCLIATSPEGCKDTFCDDVRNSYIRRIVPFNIFTPGVDGNGDGFNDEYVIDGEGLVDYNIKIFNRWGEKVFESESIDISWNGKVNNSGSECPEGTYFYVIKYKFLYGEENDGLGPIEGTVDLIRK